MPLRCVDWRKRAAVFKGQIQVQQGFEHPGLLQLQQQFHHQQQMQHQLMLGAGHANLAPLVGQQISQLSSLVGSIVSYSSVHHARPLIENQ